ncbi:MAG: EutN/CcmL family microcompartment protein [Candidatus Eisenbacteria bacterium]|nr:EutN/CcmL family microcompartment protein [Candidatus Eisenbacteria bacterium]
MNIGRVAGTVVSTRKDEKLTGAKLQVVRQIDLDGKETGAFVVAVDAVGAGAGEVVLYASGSSARLTAVTRDRPADAVIMAIVDCIEVGGRVVYEKP